MTIDLFKYLPRYYLESRIMRSLMDAMGEEVPDAIGYLWQVFFANTCPDEGFWLWLDEYDATTREEVYAKMRGGGALNLEMLHALDIEAVETYKLCPEEGITLSGDDAYFADGYYIAPLISDIHVDPDEVEVARQLIALAGMAGFRYWLAVKCQSLLTKETLVPLGSLALYPSFTFPSPDEYLSGQVVLTGSQVLISAEHKSISIARPAWFSPVAFFTDDIYWINERLFAQAEKTTVYQLEGFTSILSDGFERADPESVNIVTSGGESGPLTTADTGELWDQYLGVWQRDANGVYISEAAAGWNIAYLDSNAYNCVLEADIVWQGGNAGFVFRMTPDEDNFFVCYIMDWYMELGRVENWVLTTLDEGEMDLVAGTTYHLKLVLDGDNISFYVDDILKMSAVDTFNQTATRHGIGSSQANTNNRWNNISIVANESLVDVLGDYWAKEYPNNEYNAQISTARARSGSKALRMELHRTDALVNGSKRAEIARVSSEATALEEHWYAFSIYLPDGGDEDYLLDPNGSEILAQWHNVPDVGEDTTFPPPLALRTIGSNWRIDRVWDDNALTTNEDILANNKYEHAVLGSYLGDKGKWTDWEFHIKWGWLPEHNPIMEIYKDGVLVLERNGLPNMTNDQAGVVHKLGVYKWDWAQDPDIYSVIDKRVVYYDSVMDFKKS